MDHKNTQKGLGLNVPKEDPYTLGRNYIASAR